MMPTSPNYGQTGQQTRTRMHHFSTKKTPKDGITHHFILNFLRRLLPFEVSELTRFQSALALCTFKYRYRGGGTSRSKSQSLPRFRGFCPISKSKTLDSDWLVTATLSRTHVPTPERNCVLRTRSVTVICFKTNYFCRYW